MISRFSILKASNYLVASSITVEKTAMLNVVNQAFDDLDSGQLLNLFYYNWQSHNNGWGIVTSQRRYLLQNGDSLYEGRIATDGASFASFKKVTVTDA